MNGGTGHGTQDPNRVPFELPKAPDFRNRIIVRYPNYIDNTNTVVRSTLSKVVIPSEFTDLPITVDFRPDDLDNKDDLDSDNEGVWDATEAGQGFALTPIGGIDGADLGSGVKGL